MTMPVHVSIHDVSPLWSSEVEQCLALCAAAGARPALLVVPNFHARALLTDDARMCSRLRQLQGAGHEIFLHGFEHRAPGAGSTLGPLRRVRRVLDQRVLSAGEAELADLPETDGRVRIAAGYQVLEQAGLRVDGFVPPAWARPPWLLDALAAHGCRFTEDHLRVYDPMGGKARATALFNWASRSPARAWLTVAYCRLTLPARNLLPARIAIHPADVRVPLLRREIVRALALARGTFTHRGATLLQ
jgi:predicted deacetylase